MSLINSMLAGLEDRQADLSEGRNSVFEGLSSVNDDNFHKPEHKSFGIIAIVLLLTLVGLVSVQTYRYFAGKSSREIPVSAAVVPDRQASNPAPELSSITTESKDVSFNGVGEISSQPLSADNQTALRMDYRLSKAPVVPNEPVAEKVEITAIEEIVASEEVAASEEIVARAEVAASEPLFPPDREPSITAINVDLFAGQGSAVRLVLSEQADYRIYELNKPDRVVVEFDQYLQLPDALPIHDSAGVISKIRGHHLDNRNKRTMLVFELTEAAKVQQAEIEDTVAGHELIIQIVPANISRQISTATTEADAGISVSETEAVVYKQKEGTLSRTRNQSNPDEILSKGLNIYQKGQIRKGLDEISKALEAEPRHIQTRTTLVNMLLEQNRITDALDILSKGSALLPEQYDWLKLKAKLLVRLNRGNDAIETLIEAGPEISSDPDYYAFLAALLQQQGRNAEAVEYYRNVLNVRGDNGVWWMGLGISLERIGEQAQARDAYQTAINDQSLSPDIRNYVRNRLSAITGP